MFLGACVAPVTWDLMFQGSAPACSCGAAPLLAVLDFIAGPATVRKAGLQIFRDLGSPSFNILLETVLVQY
jgi:hypothetical protein